MPEDVPLFCNARNPVRFGILQSYKSDIHYRKSAYAFDSCTAVNDKIISRVSYELHGTVEIFSSEFIKPERIEIENFDLEPTVNKRLF